MQRAAAIISLFVLAVVFSGRTSNHAQNSETRSVTLAVTVTDKKGSYVPGLPQDAFGVFVDGKLHQISKFDNGDTPSAVGILVDVSGSIKPSTVSAVRDALPNFVAANHPQTEFFLAVVSSQPQLNQNWTRDGAVLANSLSIISKKTELKGNTALYDACYQSVQKLMSSNYRKRVLLLISDGLDNNSKHTFIELKRFFESSDVVFYVIGSLVDEASAGSALGLEGRGILDELSSVTGGRTYYPKKEVEIGKAIQNVVLDFRSQYLMNLEVDSSAQARAKRHHLKVTLTSSPDSPDLKVRSRLTYHSIS